MDNDMIVIIFFSIIGGFIAVLLGKSLTNWYHEIEKRNRYMEIQIQLLAEIALASNVKETVVVSLIKQAKFPSKEEKLIPYEKTKEKQ